MVLMMRIFVIVAEIIHLTLFGKYDPLDNCKCTLLCL